MRPRKTLRLAFIGLCISAISASTSHAAPSLDQTIEWLTAKLRGVSGSEVLTTRCNSGRIRTSTTERVITSVSINGGTILINEKFSVTYSDDPGDYFPIKSIALRLDELYATCSVKQMEPIPPTINRLCTTQMTHLPYQITLSGPNRKGYSMWVDDQELAGRIAKAFENLIRKSGGKEEVF